MGAVGRAAMAMIQEVRRQFKDIPALKKALDVMNRNEGKSSEDWSEEEREQFDQAIDSAEYGKCVEISTQSAIKEMIAPGLVAVLTPVAIGLGGNYFFPGSGARDARRPPCGGDCVRCLVGSVSIQCRGRMGQRQENGGGRL